MSQYEAIQNPIIRTTAKPEMICQLLILSLVAIVSYWIFGFELALLSVLVLGFALTTMNIVAAAVSINVHLAEVRNILQDQRKQSKLK